MRSALLRAFRRVGWMPALIPVVLGAAAALSYYGYRYAHDLARRGQQSILDTNRDLAEGMVKRVEQVVVESDRTMFELVDLENLHQFPQRWSDIVRLSPTVESALILDSQRRIVPDGYVTKKGSKADVEAFRARFEGEILPDLELSRLARDEHKHLHREYDGRYYLISYTRRQVAGRDFFIVLECDMAFLVGEIFPEIFAVADLRRVYQIVDEHDRLVFGHPFTRVPPKYVVSLPFSQTLYKWQLRVAPREAAVLVARESTRRAFDVVLVVLSAAAVFGGLGVLIFAVRTERRASELKSVFIANVSHELKTPLSLVQMFSEMLASGRIRGADQAKEYAEIINRESQRLAHLIDNILDFARLERGKSQYRFETGELGDLIARGIDLFRQRAEREGMRVTFETDEELPQLRFDPDAITLALLNLADNAIKYAAEGKELSVSLHRVGDRIRLAVHDQGPGVDPAETERIFERFYRARAVRGRAVRGSGIGLSMVKHIAEAHGGAVEVESELGHGSTFAIWLPVPADTGGPPDEDEADQPVEGKPDRPAYDEAGTRAGDGPAGPAGEEPGPKTAAGDPLDPRAGGAESAA